MSTVKSAKTGAYHCPSYGCVDRISDLPKNVVECISEKLGIRDLARTSVLSKKWRQNWISFPQLKFDFQFVQDLLEQLEYEYDPVDLPKNFYLYENVVSRVLFQHIGPIRKFCLYTDSHAMRSLEVIIPWISFLSRNGIRDLSLLKGIGGFKLVRLPSCLYSCSGLTNLNLDSWIFKPPPNFNGFRHLISFNCLLTTFKGLPIESLLYGCPLLQELSLNFCSGFESMLLIDAPNLRSCKISYTGDHSLKYICFKNTPNLSSLIMDSPDQAFPPASGKERSYIDELFRDLPKLENLIMQGYTFVPMLETSEVPRRLSSPFNLLKELKLEYFLLVDFNVIWLLSIIRSSPNLQLLELHVFSCTDHKTEPEIASYLDQQLDSFVCSLDQLLTIKFRNVHEHPLEQLMIKFLLARAPSLKKMILELRQCNEEKAFQISTELSRLRRRSPNAEVTLTISKR